MLLKIETFAILAFIIAIASVLYVGMAFGSSNSELEKQETEDEKIHEEWAKENAHSDILYQFVRCPGDTNTYPEGTKCSDDDEDEE